MDGGAYGGGKAGAPFDPIAFIQRPQVILKAICLVSFFLEYIILRFLFLLTSS